MQPTIEKAKVLERLRANRDRHRQVFEDAMVGYRAEAEAALRAKLEEVSNGRLPKQIRVSLYRPEDHTRDYDRVIEMIELDTGGTWTMSEQEFAQYMRDDWAWKRAWLLSNDKFSASTRTAYAEDFAAMEDDS
jgi:hypothetical protein